MRTLKYITTLILCLAIATVNAQEEQATKKLQFEIGAVYGMSGITGSIENGSISPSLGYNLSGIGTFFIGENIGVGAGIAYGNYNSTAILDNYLSRIPSTDDEGESFKYRISATGIEEALKLNALEIPFFVAYQKRLNEKLTINTKVGIKAQLPLSATYQCNKGDLVTSGYYESYNVEFTDMPNHGFEKIENLDKSGELAMQTSFALFLDAGVQFSKISLSLYGSYGLTSIINPDSNSLIEYQGDYQSVTSVADKVNTISVGLKLGIVF